MKIISKGHDYYDSVRAYGTDDTIKYIRKKQVFQKDTPEYNSVYNVFRLQELRHVRAYEDFMTNYWIVSFCGKIVPITKYYLSGLYHICHSIKAADKVVINHCDKKQQGLWYIKSSRYRDSLRTRALRIFNHATLNTEDLHHKFKSPIIMYERYYDRVVINPILREIEFFRYMDAFTTYQELAQYVGGVLSNTSTPPEKVSDEDKRDMHGFDKWSFKTMPKDK